MPLTPSHLERFLDNFAIRYREAHPHAHGWFARYARNSTSFYLQWVNEYAFANAEGDFDYPDLLQTAQALRNLSYRIDTPPCTREAFDEMERMWVGTRLEERTAAQAARRLEEQTTWENEAFRQARSESEAPAIDITPAPDIVPEDATREGLINRLVSLQPNNTDMTLITESDPQGNIVFIRIGSLLLFLSTPTPPSTLRAFLLGVVRTFTDAIVLAPEAASTAPDLRVSPRLYLNAKELEKLGFTEKVPEDLCDSVDTQMMDNAVRIVIGHTSEEPPKPIYDGGETYVLDKENIARLRTAPNSRKPIAECEIVPYEARQADIDAFMDKIRAEKSEKPADLPVPPPEATPKPA